jgi:PAS domain S-box-containing protein
MENLYETPAANQGILAQYLHQLKHGVAHERLKHLSKQTSTNSYVSLFLIAIVTAILYPHVPQFWLLLWATVHTTLFITLLLRNLNSKDIKPQHSTPNLTLSKKGLYHAMGWAFVSASFWGVLTLFIPYSPTFVQFGIILLMGGMAAGASTTLGSITLVSSIFILTCNLPVIIYYILQGTYESLSVAVMLATFTMAMLITTRIVNRSFTQQLSAEANNEQYRSAYFQDKIISIVNQEMDGDKALKLCLEEMAKKLGWPIGHVYWVRDELENKITSSSIWYLENMNLFRPFRRVTENTDINKENGFLARVLARKTTVWIEDLCNDPGFIRASVAKALGIKSGFAFPVSVNNEIVAILEFYNTQTSPIDKGFIEQIAPISIQIGRAIERQSNNVSLLESEARFSILVRNSSHGIIVHENGKPLFANEEVQRIFSYPLSQFIKLHSIYSLALPEDQSRLKEYDEKLVNDKHNHSGIEFTALNSSGNSIQLMIRSSVISWNGKDAILSTIVDLTTLKKTEFKLHQKLKMEAVGKLTGGIAHDFNNILMTISGNLELIHESVKEDEKLSRWCEVAQHGADRGSHLTKQLLLFSKQREMRPKDINVHDAISNLSLLTSNTIPSNIIYNYEAPENLPTINVDPSEFDSALINLIVNARDAMPDGGCLNIKAEKVSVNESSDDLKIGTYVAIIISDTGAGIPKAIENKIFEPFFSRKDYGAGFGLGLSSVLGFVQKSGGTISLDTKLNHGTSFTLYFPASDGTKPVTKTKPIAQSQTPKANGELILVVDDDPNISDVILDFLNIRGYQTISAVDGDMALKIINENPNIDLLISDIMMPGSLNGIELVSQYLNEGKNRKALLMTGYSGDQLANSATVPEDVLVLRKPFQKDKLYDAIQNTLEMT